jgi:hypothetical protein
VKKQAMDEEKVHVMKVLEIIVREHSKICREKDETEKKIKTQQ